MERRDDWRDLGPVADLSRQEVRQVTIDRTRIALIHRDGEFGAISGACNHVGGPLGEGTLDGAYLVCPWHYWKFHWKTGEGEPGFEEDRVPAFDLKEEGGHLWVNLHPRSPRHKAPHESHPLTRPIERESGPIRIVGISTTRMTDGHPRFSTSDALLGIALEAGRERGADTKMIRLEELRFRACEGYYSKSARACTWPCSITQMDPLDRMAEVYEAFVYWADVIVVATPIRWGAASSLYYKMVERMNCVQNQETIANRHLLRNKVAAFVITGGQDNVQAVAGQMLGFFAEVGCQFPQFPYIAHSRGWSAEDMENNVIHVMQSEPLREGARSLADRCIEMAELVVAGHVHGDKLTRGGRKGYHL